MQFSSVKVHHWLLLTVAGCTLGLASAYSNLWWLVYVGIGLYVYCFEKTKTWQMGWWQGWYVGTLKSGIVLSWFFAAYPLDWLGLAPGWYQLGLILLFWLPASLLLGLALALVGATLPSLTRLRWGLAVVPLGWLLAELVAALAFSIYTLGPGSSVQADFSFGFTGYTLAAHGLLLSLVAWGGVYTGTVVVVSIAIALYRMRHKLLVFALAVVLLLSSSHATPLTLAKKPHVTQPTTVAVIKTAWPRGLVTATSEQVKADAIISAVVAASNLHPEYVLLPEDARLTEYLGGVENTRRWLTQIFSSSTILIDSGRTTVSGTVVQRASVYDTAADAVYQFDKQYLVPQGEYVPYVYQILLGRLPLPADTARALRDTTYRPGISQAMVNPPANIPPVMFCFESVPPRFALPDAGTTLFIAHIVSHGWFAHPSQSLEQQLAMMLRVKAVETHIPIIQAANYTSVQAWDAMGTPLPARQTEAGDSWSVYRFSLY